MGESKCADGSLTCRAAPEFPAFRYAPLRKFRCIYQCLSIFRGFFDCTYLDNSILKTTRSNINDALIASSAISHEYILVTDDNELRRKMKKNNYEVMTYSELLNDIKNIVHKV